MDDGGRIVVVVAVVVVVDDDYGQKALRKVFRQNGNK